MTDQIRKRLEELRGEYEKGQKVLMDLQARQDSLRESLLRIAGAIQILEELSCKVDNVKQEINELTDVKS